MRFFEFFGFLDFWKRLWRWLSTGIRFSNQRPGKIQVIDGIGCQIDMFLTVFEAFQRASRADMQKSKKSKKSIFWPKIEKIEIFRKIEKNRSFASEIDFLDKNRKNRFLTPKSKKNRFFGQKSKKLEIFRKIQKKSTFIVKSIKFIIPSLLKIS